MRRQQSDGKAMAKRLLRSREIGIPPYIVPLCAGVSRLFATASLLLRHRSPIAFPLSSKAHLRERFPRAFHHPDRLIAEGVKIGIGLLQLRVGLHVVQG